VGTGDGRFVYRSALREPEKFFIGIDANAGGLGKISEKIYRRQEKGGAPNALFLQAAAEDLPDELTGIADEVRVQFPWGSLLGAVARGEELTLIELRKIMRPNAKLIVLIGFDPDRDRAELNRLGVSDLSAAYIEEELRARYQAAGLAVESVEILSPSAWPEIESSWARKLRGSVNRKLIHLRATVDRVRVPTLIGH
jgi:16S rRNA (adenine(1408)-N(1))-methyltransferase